MIPLALILWAWGLSTAGLLLWWKHSSDRQAAEMQAGMAARTELSWQALQDRSARTEALVERDRLQAALTITLRKVDDARLALQCERQSAERAASCEGALRELGRTLHARSTAAEFWPPGCADSDDWVGTQLALIMGEGAEALEALRDGKRELYYSPEGKPEGVAAELADVLIRTLDLGEGLGLDLPLAVVEKHRYNLTRPARHGRNF